MSEPTARKPGRGGRRAGSGQPKIAENVARVSVTVPAEMLAELETIASTDGISTAALIRDLLSKSLTAETRANKMTLTLADYNVENDRDPELGDGDIGEVNEAIERYNTIGSDEDRSHLEWLLSRAVYSNRRGQPSRRCDPPVTVRQLWVKALSLHIAEKQVADDEYAARLEAHRMVILRMATDAGAVVESGRGGQRLVVPVGQNFSLPADPERQCLLLADRLHELEIDSPAMPDKPAAAQCLYKRLPLFSGI